MRRILLLLLPIMAGAIPGYAEQAAVNPQLHARFGALRQSGTPYARLFEAREALNKALPEKTAALPSAPKRTVVCGMTVIEATPSLDPQIGVTPLKDQKTRFTIRAVEPPICRPK